MHPFVFFVPFVVNDLSSAPLHYPNRITDYSLTPLLSLPLFPRAIPLSASAFACPAGILRIRYGCGRTQSAAPSASVPTYLVPHLVLLVLLVA